MSGFMKTVLTTESCVFFFSLVWPPVSLISLFIFAFARQQPAILT